MLHVLFVFIPNISLFYICLLSAYVHHSIVFLVSGIYCIINCVHLNRALHLSITPAVLGFTHYLEKVVLQNHTHTA